MSDENLANHPALVTDAQLEGLKKIMTELKIEDKSHLSLAGTSFLEGIVFDIVKSFFICRLLRHCEEQSTISFYVFFLFYIQLIIRL